MYCKYNLLLCKFKVAQGQLVNVANGKKSAMDEYLKLCLKNIIVIEKIEGNG